MKRSNLLLLVGTIVLTILLSSCEETTTPIDPGGGGNNNPTGFSGVIMDTSTNTPIVGATVWLFAQPNSDATLTLVRSKSKRINSFIIASDPFDHRYSGTALQKVTTDSLGRFLLDTTQFTANNYIIAVTHPNYSWRYFTNKGSKGLGTLYTTPVITVPAGQGQSLDFSIKEQDYVVTGSISPTSLVIREGVRVRINPNQNITFLNGGVLTATSNSPLQPIRITVNSDNANEYMGNIGLLTSNISLNNVHISGAGAGNSPALTLDEATGNITRVIITNCNNGVTFRGLKVAISLTVNGVVIRNINETAVTASNSVNNTISNSVIYNAKVGVNHTNNSSLDYVNCYIGGNTNAYTATGGMTSLSSCEIVAGNGTAVQLRNPSQASLDSCELTGNVSLDSDASGVQVGFISDCNLMGTDAQFVHLSSVSYNFLGCYFNGVASESSARSKVKLPSGNNVNDLQLLGTVFSRIDGSGLKTW
jgi:hypothetical protein